MDSSHVTNGGLMDYDWRRVERQFVDCAVNGGLMDYAWPPVEQQFMDCAAMSSRKWWSQGLRLALCRATVRGLRCERKKRQWSFLHCLCRSRFSPCACF